MSNNNTNLTILSTTIRRDAEGRYCLNDCHKASGADKKDGPSYWLATDQAQALISELTDTENPVSPVSTKRGGTNQGTYAVKELVYAYAMWISPAFHLTVIRAFDALITGQIPSASTKAKRIRKTPVLRAFRDGYGIAKTLGLDDNQAASHAGRYCLHKCGENPLPALGLDTRTAPTQDNYQTVTELGRPLGLSGQRVNKILEEKGLQVHTKGSSSSSNWSMTDKGLAYGRMFDAVRVGSTGSQQILKWKPSTVEFLRPFAKVPA